MCAFKECYIVKKATVCERKERFVHLWLACHRQDKSCPVMAAESGLHTEVYTDTFQYTLRGYMALPCQDLKK